MAVRLTRVYTGSVCFKECRCVCVFFHGVTVRIEVGQVVGGEVRIFIFIYLIFLTILRARGSKKYTLASHEVGVCEI